LKEIIINIWQNVLQLILPIISIANEVHFTWKMYKTVTI